MTCELPLWLCLNKSGGWFNLILYLVVVSPSGDCYVLEFCKRNEHNLKPYVNRVEVGKLGIYIVKTENGWYLDLT